MESRFSALEDDELDQLGFALDYYLGEIMGSPNKKDKEISLCKGLLQEVEDEYLGRGDNEYLR